MALAVIVHEGPAETASEGRERFRIDIGKNHYWSFAIGDGTASRQGGFDVLQDPSHISELFGPLPQAALGRTVLDVPSRMFDREHRHIQLASFRDEKRVGPALSGILKVPLGGSGDHGELRPPAFFARNPNRSLVMSSTALSFSAEQPTGAVESVPFRYRERAVSEAMFLGSLISLLPSLLPKLVPLAGTLLSGLAGGVRGGLNGATNGGGAGAAAPLLQALTNPDAVRMITEFLQQLASGAVRAQSLAYPRSGDHSSGPYSEAKFAPALLLTALPALMPLLEKVLSPETLKVLMDKVPNPTEILKLGLESHEQDLKHLRELNPGVVDKGLDQLLLSLGLDTSKKSAEPRFRRVAAVHLQFEDPRSQTLYGRTQLPYRSGVDLEFPLRIETPRPIAGGVLQVVIKHAQSLRLVLQRQYRIEQVASGRMQSVPRFSREELEALAPGTEYLVRANLTWKTKQGERCGASVTQLIALVGEYCFDRVEEAGEAIPLNDVARHREWWHKVWQGTFDTELKGVTFQAKYYYALEPERTANARMETVTALEKSGVKRETGRLKSGMIMSSAALNRLIPVISDQAPLGEAELSALRSRDFIERFNQAARVNLTLKGRRGDSAALWVYPEVKMQRVILQHVAETTPAGQVVRFEERVVYFPIPALIHAVGTRT